MAKARAEEFIHLFVNNEGWLIKFLEEIVNRHEAHSPIIYNTLLELYLQDDEVCSNLSEKQNQTN